MPKSSRITWISVVFHFVLKMWVEEVLHRFHTGHQIKIVFQILRKEKEWWSMKVIKWFFFKTVLILFWKLLERISNRRGILKSNFLSSSEITWFLRGPWTNSQDIFFPFSFCNSACIISKHLIIWRHNALSSEDRQYSAPSDLVVTVALKSLSSKLNTFLGHLNDFNYFSACMETAQQK